MARPHNFQFTRRMSSGVSGRGYMHLRADASIIEATQCDARLPRLVRGGQRWSEEEVGGGRRRLEEVGDCFLCPFWRRWPLLWASAASSFLSGDGGSDAKWLLYALRRLRGRSGGHGAATTTDNR